MSEWLIFINFYKGTHIGVDLLIDIVWFQKISNLPTPKRAAEIPKCRGGLKELNFAGAGVCKEFSVRRV